MKRKLPVFLICACLFLAFPSMNTKAAQEKDYLSALEADKIRDAETSAERIKLFLTFADDRLKKFQYELEHPSSNKHVEMLNALLNAYVGCVDDAADVMQLGIEKQDLIDLAGAALVQRRRRSREFNSGDLVELPDETVFRDRGGADCRNPAARAAEAAAL